MVIKFGEASIGAKFRGKGYAEIVYMKIKKVQEKTLFEGTPSLPDRNVVIVEGKNKGGVGFLPDEHPVELIP